MKTLKITKANIAKQTLREQISHRGGGIEIDLTKFGYPEQKMTAYQNYLGGGMLGAVAGDCTKKDWKEDETLVKIQEVLKEYFFNLTNPTDDEWSGSTYEQNQQRSVAAY